MLSVLALSRLQVVSKPLETNFTEPIFVLKIIAVLFSASVCVALFSTTMQWAFYHNIHIPMGVCSPFVDPEDNTISIKIFAWFVVILQCSSTVAILVTYIKMFKSLQESQQRLKDSVSKQRDNLPVIIQIIAITSSSILCWIPSCVVFLLSMFLTEYPIQMVVWIIIAVSPINSFLNPTIFLVLNFRKLQEK